MRSNGWENETDVSLEAFMYRCIYYKSVYLYKIFNCLPVDLQAVNYTEWC